MMSGSADMCDCAALVLAVVFYCFHHHKLQLYDLSKCYTLILEGSNKKIRGDLGNKGVSTEYRRHNSEDRKKGSEKERQNAE